jgi:sigma-70-like protein
MSTIAVTARLVALPVRVGVPQGSSLGVDGQWQPGLRRPAATAGLAGQASRRGADVPGGLLAELAGLAVGDPRRVRLRARIIEWYLPMSVYLARRFGGRGELLDDLTQVAAVGLIKAVDRAPPPRLHARGDPGAAARPPYRSLRYQPVRPRFLTRAGDDFGETTSLRIRRRDHLGGILHEYERAPGVRRLLPRYAGV